MRVVIAENSVILRDGLVALLSRRGHEIAAAVGDGDALVSQIATLAAADALPDVAVIDVRMPPEFTDEGLRAALTLRATHPGLGVLLFSQYVETRYAAQLFGGDARGVGYLLKDRVADVGDFLDALERIAAGHTVLDPEVVSQLMGAARVDTGVARLTARETEVLELMAEGRSNGAIAESMFLSYGAVEKHVTLPMEGDGGDPDAQDDRTPARCRWRGDDRRCVRRWGVAAELVDRPATGPAVRPADAARTGSTRPPCRLRSPGCPGRSWRRGRPACAEFRGLPGRGGAVRAGGASAHVLNGAAVNRPRRSAVVHATEDARDGG